VRIATIKLKTQSEYKIVFDKTSICKGCKNGIENEEGNTKCQVAQEVEGVTIAVCIHDKANLNDLYLEKE